MIGLEEIEKAYDAYSRELHVYIYRHVRNESAAEDLLQEVFLKLIQYSKKSRVNAGNIRALLYRIAATTCIDFSRKNRADVQSFDPHIMDATISSDEPDDGGTESEIIDVLNSLASDLREPEKSILMLRKAGRTFDEITKLLEIPERTLKRKMKKITDELRNKMQEKGFFR